MHDILSENNRDPEKILYICLKNNSYLHKSLIIKKISEENFGFFTKEKIQTNEKLMSIPNKIIAYLGRTPDFQKEILLRNDGSGNYIFEWNATDKSKPTDEQLNALSSEAETLKNNNKAIANRKKEYGTPEDMIEFITENGLEAWQTKVQEIKTKYPKE